VEKPQCFSLLGEFSRRMLISSSLVKLFDIVKNLKCNWGRMEALGGKDFVF